MICFLFTAFPADANGPEGPCPARLQPRAAFARRGTHLNPSWLASQVPRLQRISAPWGRPVSLFTKSETLLEKDLTQPDLQNSTTSAEAAPNSVRALVIPAIERRVPQLNPIEFRVARASRSPQAELGPPAGIRCPAWRANTTHVYRSSTPRMVAFKPAQLRPRPSQTDPTGPKPDGPKCTQARRTEPYHRTSIVPSPGSSVLANGGRREARAQAPEEAASNGNAPA